MTWKEILAPTDFSEAAQAALTLALDLAEANAANVTILHAYHLVIPLSVPPSGGGFRMPGHVARELREHARNRVERLVRESSRPGVHVGGRAIEEPPAVAIVEEARRIGADLIVMGARGRRGVAQAFMGSVAERVIRNAPCPVLTTRAGAV